MKGNKGCERSIKRRTMLQIASLGGGKTVRFILAILLLCSATVWADGEEAYLAVQSQLGACLGVELRSVVSSNVKITLEELDAILRERCGPLEDRAIQEFGTFLDRQLTRTRSSKERAALATKILLEIELSPHELRRKVEEVYSAAVLHPQ
jgi:hypothetical protein